MKHWRFEGLLQKKAQWLSPAFVETDDKGIIIRISSSKNKDQEPTRYAWAIPGFQNAHSHAFQYAMAGQTEYAHPSHKENNFWSWRKSMYGLAESLSPEDMEAIATQLYVEMIRHGYTSVAEFHYLHHDPYGNPYNNPAEMGERLVRAAQRAGIRLTLLPVFYSQSNFQSPANSQQRRFLSKSVEDYLSLWEATKKMTQGYSNVQLGMAIHSLRAAKPKDVQEIASLSSSLAIPLHIHIAEQRKEVEDCTKALGKRPVEWLLENTQVGENFFLVHATHTNEKEIQALVNAKATVVLCPSTEGNLGDGFFAMEPFWKAGGRWCIGTDSHVSLSPMEELRWLDYGQRLQKEKRNIFCLHPEEDSGNISFHESIRWGRAAMGNSHTEYFSVGQPLDAVVINSPLIEGAQLQRKLSTFLYSSDSTAIQTTIVAGQCHTKNKHYEIASNFSRALKNTKF